MSGVSSSRPSSTWSLRRPRRPGALELVRRGVHHGWVHAPVPAATGLPRPAAGLERWAAAEPIHLPGILAASLARHKGAIRSSLALFDRLRTGASFQDELWRRLRSSRTFEPAGASMDLADPREIEKVFANARRGGRLAARDLYAKLSWIAVDPRDTSLRIRFSFGAEQLREWQGETRRAPWADRLAAEVFPESAVLTGQRRLTAFVARCAGRAVRFSERIVYSNAPAGGAIFHHDEEPHQLGVLYGQLAGATAWLALPKRRLAAELVAAVAGTPQRRKAPTPAAALRWLDSEGDAALLRLLNHTPRFTARLVAQGHLLVLRPGDALLLPSPSAGEVAWHSVFALGSKPSLAHSYGVFRSRRRSPEP